MLYFAYGSNMSSAQMRERCPGHERIGIGMLPGHKLCFPRSSPIRQCGVASIAPRPGSEVWGVIYRLTAPDLAALDRREGYNEARDLDSNRYLRKIVQVRMEADLLDCGTYEARPEPGAHIPSLAYLATIIEGAEENGLPSGYVASLRSIPGG